MRKKVCHGYSEPLAYSLYPEMFMELHKPYFIVVCNMQYKHGLSVRGLVIYTDFLYLNFLAMCLSFTEGGEDTSAAEHYWLLCSVEESILLQ